MIKSVSFNLFKKFLCNKRIKPVFADYYSNLAQQKPELDNVSNPYTSKSTCNVKSENSFCRSAIIVTGRFRSGTTALWNMFRHIENCKAYYEPFNERRWFDEFGRGTLVDPTHIGVSDYWKEYEGLNDLSNIFDNSWSNENLLMSDRYYNPRMKKFIEHLVENGSSYTVLQFNRIDFRLPWFNSQFRNFPILHIYRHPRNQWLSFLTDKKKMNKNNIEATYKDGFYLDVWCEDLKYHYPFLCKSITPHPYIRFYLIWKLSLIYGKKYASYSFSLEELTSVTLQKRILEQISITTSIPLKSLIESAKNVLVSQDISKWKTYAEENWFEALEEQAECILDEFLK